MFDKEQRQQVGDGSLAIQTTGDVTLHFKESPT